MHKQLASLIASICVVLGIRGSSVAADRPRLVILISVDQMRSDYLTRYGDLFLPASIPDADGRRQVGGFRYLEASGAWHVDAQHSHFPLFTGPGHAVELTGACPYKSGIVGNYWYDRRSATNRYCVEDPEGKIVGNDIKTKLPDVSPRSLLVTTVGDELKMATGGRARVWAIGLKDRAAILLGGHLADGALWFDEETGNWVTSSYYATNGILRPWLRELNASRLVNQFTNAVWNFEKTKALDRVWTWTEASSHSTTGTNYQAFTVSPMGNDFVFELAKRVIEKESLGQIQTEGRQAPHASDLLAINLSSNDYVGHYYGPDSAEMLDVTLKTDTQLSAFFNWLDQRKLLAQSLIVLTSDHGVSPLPAQMRSDAHFSGAIGYEAEVQSSVQRFLADRYGVRGTNSPVKVVEFNVYIDPSDLAWTNAAPSDIHDEVARFLTDTHTNGVYVAYTKEQILKGQLPRTDVAMRVMNGYYPGLSGDIVLVPQPYWIQLNATSKYKSSHGSPYAYDTSVPLLLSGPGITPGIFTEPASTLDIAPTISFLLGVIKPSGAEGKLLMSVRR
ncbi:MAG TPA: alkaline phosphatase family protein [Verrucomicrobiota bacterium]|nr:hypothetical protein [Verrucomicrobiales bacterium]HRI14861.1 alkaline phosphatase family protein [Verrucomicrobiota bacterium]